MHLSKVILGAVALMLGACAAAAPATPTVAPGFDPTPITPPMPSLQPERIARGEVLYAQQCASCHGVNREGQPNWKQPLANGKYPAPPHDDTGHTWHHPDSLLVQIILDGGNGTNGAVPSNMPPFRQVLTEDDARAVLEFLKSRWSPDMRRYQWQMTAQTDGAK